MVMYLPSPKVDCVTLVDDIVEERVNGINSDYFESIREEWKARVQEYIDENGSPRKIQPWPYVTSHKQKFQNLYKHPQEQSVQKPILDSLRSRELQICPACGEDGTPNTLDHYLPKEAYPEFSITPINLSPMCDICQGKKGTKTVNEMNERLFLHPYFDEFVSSPVLSLKIGKPYRSPEMIEVVAHCDLTPAQSKLVNYHLTELDIVKRYYRYFRDQYFRLLKLVRFMKESGQNIQTNLETFKFNESLKSINSWPHIFYASVLEDNELMIYLENEV